ncbi:hypothetical protein COO60DRAFT_780072 [Scenedesmus sp. NREL 46B-D3]|nr:hypothetical protein COO60DRAFT_780072 [Scenedesmus sp. NREL 46B-D3]
MAAGAVRRCSRLVLALSQLVWYSPGRQLSSIQHSTITDVVKLTVAAAHRSLHSVTACCSGLASVVSVPWAVLLLLLLPRLLQPSQL